MARYPEWFAQFDAIIDAVRAADQVEWFGRQEIRAIFSCSERDSIRLLHRFGAQARDDALSIPRCALARQLQAVRAGSTYLRFLSQRQDVAKQLAVARSEASARQFRIERAAAEQGPTLGNLPETITLRRPAAATPGVFEVLYKDGPDLMRQIAEFLTAAGVNRSEFLTSTEPPE